VSASLSSQDFIQSHILVESQPGYRFCMEWAENIIAQTGSIVGRSLKNPLVLGAVLRLLRYLNAEMQDRWLTDLLTLTKASRKSTSLLSSLPDWQPCLFHLISETLEFLRTVSSKKDLSKSLVSVGGRLDLCLELYSTLLGHQVREGGDKVSIGSLGRPARMISFTNAVSVLGSC
jgi:hypothetical protein